MRKTMEQLELDIEREIKYSASLNLKIDALNGRLKKFMPREEHEKAMALLTQQYENRLSEIKIQQAKLYRIDVCRVEFVGLFIFTLKGAATDNLTIAELLRRYIEKGMKIDGYKQDIDFISGIIRQEFMAVYHLEDINGRRE